MICPNCRHENPQDAKFCNNCGSPMVSRCPNCDHENPPGSRFCNNCGHSLAAAEKAQVMAESSTPPAPARALMPREIAAKLESARTNRTMAGERRIVTMLFCDLTGSTAAAENLDPEEWAEVINQAFEHMIVPIYKYEGTVARLMGDGILAFFGAPVAHEDDAERAVLAGLAIVDGLKPHKEKVAREWGLDIDVRVGINTGLVMVGQVGSDLQMEYTAVGDAINLAARMEQTAEPGSVQISEQTYEKVAPLFEFEALGSRNVKGKIEAVTSYRPLRRKRMPGRLRGIEGLDSPLVGRTLEFEKLLVASSNLASGLGGILCLIGESGLGKSRLIKELQLKLAQNEADFPSAWFETTSFSYETSQPYTLFKRLLRRLWQITSTDSPLEVRQKIGAALPNGTPNQEIFHVLMGISSNHEPVTHEGEAYKRELYGAVSDLWRRETLRNPTVLVLDDLHWADPASVELLIHLFTLTDQTPLLLICALRPDRDAPGWKIKQIAESDYPHRYTEIPLSALSNQDTNALVDNLLTIAELPSKLRQRILEKSDGNPLFVEEVVRSLIDRKLIVAEKNGRVTRWRVAGKIEEGDIPHNLQILLTAGIDRLEEATRRTLQLASVIGRSFYYRVLLSIHDTYSGSFSDLDHELITLQRKDLIHQAALQPEPEYLFRHVLAQEAAYNTILLSERRIFHRRVGKAIEELFAGRLEEFYAVLAHHFDKAKDPRAITYGLLAGDEAYRLYAIPEALGFYSRSLQMIRRESLSTPANREAQLETATPEMLKHLYLRRGRCLELSSDYAAAVQNYAEMEALGREKDDLELVLASLLAQATAFAIPTPVQNTDKGQTLAEEALLLARKLGDQQAEAKIYWIFMLLKNYSGYMVDGIPFGQQSVELARRLGMQQQLGLSLQDLGLAYMSAGRLEEAVAALKEARSIWEVLNNLPFLAENLANTSFVHFSAAQFEAAMIATEESLRIARSIDNKRGVINARTFTGLVHIARGEVDQVLDLAKEIIPAAELEGHPGDIICWFYLGYLYRNLGAHDLAKEAAEMGDKSSRDFPPFRPLSMAMAVRQSIFDQDFETAVARMAEADQPGLRQTLHLIDYQVDLAMTELYLARRDFALAQESMTGLLEKLNQSGARLFLPDALRLQSILLSEQGQEKEARIMLTAARAEAEKFEDRIILWRILAELGEKEAARNVVDFIAAHISDPDLRRTFLTHAQKFL